MNEERILAGRYRLLERLGEGGAGTVWRARDEMLRRDVAVKRLRGGEAFAERAITEARAAARVSHPSIVMVHDVVTDDGQPWIVMDLAGGSSLDRVIDRQGPLAPARVAAIGLSVLDALEAAHAHGLLHRDVKPANVLLGEDGTAMLSDFGIAVPMTGEASTASRAGSAGYTAPERLREEPAGPASDLWSLGATLYTAVEGRAPFHNDHPAAVAAAVLMREPPDPVRAGPALGSLLHGMLAKDPQRRPDAAAIRQVLHDIVRADRVAGGHSGGFSGPRPVMAGPSAGRSANPSVFEPTTTPVRRGLVTPPPPAAPRRRGPLWAGAAVLAVALAAGAVVTVRTVTAEEPVPDRGRFAATPEACGLLTAEQARGLIGEIFDPRMTRVDECTWQHTKGTGNYRWLSVQAQAVPPQGGKSAGETARMLFERRKKEAAAATGTDTEFGRQTWSPVRDVPGVGDGAFTQDYWRVGRNISRTICSTTLRVDNLIVEVVWTRAEDGGVTPDDQRTVRRAAELVAAGLGTSGKTVRTSGG
ncbi:serine/threonine-protein kinase [Planobispora siamensis]|uniref:non-specific serine/threonine protein kinase n=1 Tax=Planobispora siamensis TaxID=936338 RepID=A0A8J3SFE9_9ACTN|nr:serine/threonine-protein kinase [Planobispora siamensis]GIH92339.1 hypothetical protein Psi01_29690 [Planobispora siamensis]